MTLLLDNDEHDNDDDNDNDNVDDQHDVVDVDV